MKFLDKIEAAATGKLFHSQVPIMEITQDTQTRPYGKEFSIHVKIGANAIVYTDDPKELDTVKRGVRHYIANEVYSEQRELINKLRRAMYIYNHNITEDVALLMNELEESLK